MCQPRGHGSLLSEMKEQGFPQQSPLSVPGEGTGSAPLYMGEHPGVGNSLLAMPMAAPPSPLPLPEAALRLCPCLLFAFHLPFASLSMSSHSPGRPCSPPGSAFTRLSPRLAFLFLKSL